jgi:hypothetical protein
MVKFLDSLPQVFRERYLDVHELYLKSIADVITYLYWKKRRGWKEPCRKMILKLIPAGNLPRRKDVGHETLHFRNLRNCWYHECALHHPLRNIDRRLRFAAWKIIQCYYTVFSSIASLVRLENTDIKGHDRFLNFYLSNFICRRNRRKFFLPPANFYLSQDGIFSRKFSKKVNWKYADSYHLPNIKECLEYTKNEMQQENDDRELNVRIGIPHYLKILRDWTNYQDAYLFFRLYGQTVKQNLDFCLKRMTFIHCVQTEFFMMKTFGWDAVNLQFETFMDELETNLGISSPVLECRFNVYLENLDLF